MEIIMFCSPHCKPCHILWETFKDISVTVHKRNVEENVALAQQFNVISLPTTVFLEEGKEVYRFVGTKRKDDIQRLINEYS